MISSKRQLDRIMSMFTSASEGLWLMDAGGTPLFFNSTFYGQFDLPRNPQLSDWVALVHPDDREMFTNKVNDHVEKEYQGQRIQNEYRVLKNDGTYAWIEAVGVMNHDGENYMVGCHKDVTHEREMQSTVHNLAFYDQLTALPNGAKYRSDFTKLSDSETHSLIFIHAESIKSQFSLYGTEFTDKIITHMVRSFSVFNRYQAKCYRTTMDIFLVLIPITITESELEEVIKEFLHKCLSDNENESQLSEMINLILGAIQFDSKSQYCAEGVVQWASKTSEYAMHHTSQKWAICNESLRAKIERFFYIESSLQKAIEKQDISIHLQPIFDANTKKLSTFEALARWENSDIGAIYPDEFISTAERKGLISALGESVFKQACQFIARYNNKWKSNTRINVNVSVLQLYDAQFPQRVIEVVKDFNIKPEWIVLELTESVLLDTKHFAMEQLEKLKAYGFKLSMDDFGTGYTSIMGFFKLPFRQIKLDRELATEAMQSNEALSYMSFVTQLCADNNIEVTVEGIENSAMLDQFTTIKANFLQGYFLSRPLKVEDALNFHRWPIE